jgi:myo-inositol 2-dehydrogenase / D-chiro-inositol 1-dehydrogenase
VTTRVGFLGGGFIASYHGKMLHTSDADAEIVAVHDPDAQKAAAFAAASGASVMASEAELLDCVDAVYVCTWTSEHPRLVELVAERGLPVFCEKPLATKVADARRMADTVQAAGVVNQVGLVLRDSPAFLMLASLIQQPESGRVMSVVFRDDQFIPIQGMYDSTWRAEVDKCGAGTLLEHSIHDIDLLEFLLGPANRVTGMSAGFHGHEGIEDAVVATLGFESGALATLTSVWHDVLERPSLRYVEVFCERAYFALDGDVFGPLRWTRAGGGGGTLEGEALVAELDARGVVRRHPDAAFIEAVQTDSPAHPDFATAVRAHELTDAIYRSAADGGAAIAV